MALITSVVQQCSMCLSERYSRSLRILEAECGHRNALSTNMSCRLNSLLLCNFSKLFFRSKHKFARRLLHKIDGYIGSSSVRSKTINKVPVSMRHDSLNDLFNNGKPRKDSGMNLMDGFDASLACKLFPSIILGHSNAVELYDGTADYTKRSTLLEEEISEELLPCFIDQKCADKSMLSETLHSISIGIEKSSHRVNVAVETQTSETEVKLDSYSAPTTWPPLSSLQKGETSSFKEETSHRLPLCTESQTSVTGVKSLDMILDKSISSINGLTKKQCGQLENCGFHTVRKLINHFPRTYADLHNAQFGIDDGQYLIFVGKILSSRGVRASHSFSFLEVVVGCEVVKCESESEHTVDHIDGRRKRTIYFHLKKFFRGTRFTYQPFLKSIQEKHKEGDIVCVSGKVRTLRTKDHYEMREYNMDLIQNENDESACAEGRPYPIYPSKGGLNPKLLEDLIGRTLAALPVNIDPIPEYIIQEFGLKSLHNAYIAIHQPKNFNDADLARKRFIFDEFFYLQLGRLFQMLEGLGTRIEKDVLLDKYRNPEMTAVFVEEWCSLTKTFLKALPYSLTSSQLKAVSEIIWDLKRKVPMNRLLQGDVGCGKTVVAFLACMEVIGSGYQAAFMVPTELLANQHYEHILGLIDKMEYMHCKPSVALLTGSTPSKKSRLIREGLQSGDIALVIGTHSLIADKVEFSALRIAVVDEQHRFGVIQRGRFNSKLYSVNSPLNEANLTGSSKNDVLMAPHVLAMSATPIPRTLALALYGDMSLTQITDLPPGRIPIETFVIEGSEIGFEKVYQMMLEELESGGRIYVVYPVIEKSEQLPQLRGASADLETISNRFQGISCGLLHGRMKNDEKDDALRRFKSGETQILLSTQVIEIGVDVPDASMMVVMNAERFGIAQLHQLRGRVGRGVRKSKCVLITSTVSGVERLKVLEKSSDGFQLANMDLLLRGPGDLLGKKQSGHLPEFPIARLEVDGNILQDAHVAALKILGKSHNLEEFPYLKAELSMRQPLCLLGD